MPTFASLPETRPLEYLARRQRPRWGLRFLFLLVVSGGTAYALKPYVPWIDARVTPVEQVVRGQIAKYRTKIGPMIGLGAPAPATAPVTTPSAPPPVAPVAARPVVDAPARPGIEPIVPRANRTGAGTPVAATTARVVIPSRTAAPAKGFGRAGMPGARAAGGRYLGAGKTARPMSRAAARRAAKASALARARASRAAMMAAAAAARAEAASPSVTEVNAAEPPVVELPTPALPAAPPAAAPAKEPVAVAAAEKVAPPPAAAAPAEDDRSVNTLVQSAARSGDELDRLMAGAVQSGAAARSAPREGNTDQGAAIERKLADVQKPRVAAGAANAAGISRQPLSRSDISMVMQDVQKNVRDCFRQHGKGGVADVKVDVAPEGNVIGTVIRGDLAGTPTGACVETRLKAATFPPSTGMRFDYRLLVK